MLNRVILMGRLVADPELRTTPGGVAVATVRLAVDRDFRNKQTGERETDFINVVAWRLWWRAVSRSVPIRIGMATSAPLPRWWRRISISAIPAGTERAAAATAAKAMLPPHPSSLLAGMPPP